MYVFYPDVYFASQFITALYAVAVVGCIYKVPFKIRTLLLSAIGFGVVSTLMVIWIHPYKLYCVLVHIPAIPAVLYLACRPNNGRELLREIVTSYVAIWTLYGCMEWITVQTGRSGNLVLCGCAICVYMAVFMAVQVRNHINNRISVILCHRDLRITVIGYWDTGNMLTDPYSLRPVHVASREVLKPLLDAWELPMRLIPYETVSGRELMESIMIDELILCRKKPVIIKKAVIGIATSEVFCGRDYQLLLNVKQMSS